jgi:Rrf2 family protein
MNVNSQFAVATHIMAILAGNSLYMQDSACTNSGIIAESVNTNPVVIRRILSKLKEANLVTSKPGPLGGSEITRYPSKINLRDIYSAVDEGGSLFHMHYGEPNHNCPIGGNIRASLTGTMEKAESSIKKALSKTTLLELTNDILERAGISTTQSPETITNILLNRKLEYEKNKSAVKV